MIDIYKERIIRPVEAARVRPLGRNGRPTNVSTIYRWMMKGVDGVKLESIRIGGSLFTSEEALQRFAERLTCRKSPTTTTPQPPAEARHEQKVEQALTDLGYS